MMRGSYVAVTWPNCDALILFPLPPIPGFSKLAWLKMLKNSARNSSLVRSVIDVVFEKAISRLMYPGPRIKLRGSVPYVASAGFATTCALDGNIPGPGTQGGCVGSGGSGHWALEKLLGLNNRLPGARGSSEAVDPTIFARTLSGSPAPEGPSAL